METKTKRKFKSKYKKIKSTDSLDKIGRRMKLIEKYYDEFKNYGQIKVIIVDMFGANIANIIIKYYDGYFWQNTC